MRGRERGSYTYEQDKMGDDTFRERWWEQTQPSVEWEQHNRARRHGVQEQEQVHAEERARCPTEQEAPTDVQAVTLENCRN